MPAVKVAECETAADVIELARETAERRRRLSQAPEAVQRYEQHIEDEIKWLEARIDVLADEAGALRRPTIATIKHAVATVYGITLVDLISNRRAWEVMRPRQVAMLLCRILTGRSYPYISRYMGCRDHTTILHAVHKLEWLKKQLSAELSIDDPPEAWAVRAAVHYPPVARRV